MGATAFYHEFILDPSRMNKFFSQIESVLKAKKGEDVSFKAELCGKSFYVHKSKEAAIDVTTLTVRRCRYLLVAVWSECLVSVKECIKYKKFAPAICKFYGFDAVTKCSLAGWVRDPRSKYNLLTMLSIVLFLRSYLFYDYIGIVFITHVHTHLYYSPSRSDTHHFTITLLNIYHHTIKYKSFLNHTIT